MSLVSPYSHSVMVSMCDMKLFGVISCELGVLIDQYRPDRFS